MILENSLPYKELAPEKGPGIKDVLINKFNELFQRFGKGLHIRSSEEFTLREGDAVGNQERLTGEVFKTVEDTRTLTESGVSVSQEKYELAKSAIIEAKQKVFSYLETKKREWWIQRKEREYQQLLANIQKVRAERNARIAKAEAAIGEVEQKDSELETLEAMFRHFVFPMNTI